MPQHRDLVPVTIYVTPAVLDKLEKQARDEHSNVSAIGRRVLARWAKAK